MVAIALDWGRNPVSTAQVSVHNSGGDVSGALNSAHLPADVPVVGDSRAMVGGWARYIGMVQDIWDAEIFASTTTSARSGLLVEDCAACADSSAKLSERLPVYVVSLPGATKWVRGNDAREEGSPQTHPQGRPKRARENAPMAVLDDQPVATAGTQLTDGATHSTEKRARASSSDAQRNSSFAGMGLNLPCTGEQGGSAVLAKIYDNYSGIGLKVNSVVEVIGILQSPLQLMRSHDAHHDDEDDAFLEEAIARNPMNVPRLHAVRLRVLQPWEINPLVVEAVSIRSLAGVKQELQEMLPTMRQLLVRYLSSVLYGDLVAAEYVLMTLVSRPASRTSAGGTIGKLSLNLILPAEQQRTEQGVSDAEEFTQAVEALLPSVTRVDINIAALNSMDLFPKKDYRANRLRAAPLQLPSGGCLLADETALSNGQLAERGVKNVRALTAVSTRCVVPADFQFYDSELPVDNCSIFLSRGGKSIVGTDVRVRVVPDRSLDLQSWRTNDDAVMRKLRLALGVLAEDGNFKISDNVTKVIEEHFVNARRQGLAKDGQESLTRWLSVARAAARTFGEGELTRDRWEYAMSLESRREEHLARARR